MEALNLQQLSLILDQDLVIVPGETLPQPQTTADAAAQLGSSITALVEDSHEPEYAEEVRRISYEGGFEKGILVVFQGNSLDNSHREFLFKVLGAVGCSLKDVALVSSTHILELPPESVDQLAPRRYLVFGSFNHPIMKFKKANYEIVSGEREYFFADALADLADNVQLKRNLWNGLQVLFQINK
jgi:hypothetical protein